MLETEACYGAGSGRVVRGTGRRRRAAAPTVRPPREHYRTLRYTCALSTPRISLVVPKSAVSVHVLGMTVVRGRTGTAVGAVPGWVGEGVVPTQYPPSLLLRATLVLPGPTQLPEGVICVHPGTPGPGPGPSAHPGSSHSDTRIYPPQGQ